MVPKDGSGLGVHSTSVGSITYNSYTNTPIAPTALSPVTTTYTVASASKPLSFTPF